MYIYIYKPTKSVLTNPALVTKVMQVYQNKFQNKHKHDNPAYTIAPEIAYTPGRRVPLIKVVIHLDSPQRNVLQCDQHHARLATDRPNTNNRARVTSKQIYQTMIIILYDIQ